MAETEFISPWADPPSAAAPAAGTATSPTAVPAARPWYVEWAWGAISTALLAVWISLWGGWLWALALVGGVFVHEFGHVLVINWTGAGPSSIRIIPFFGGAATMRRNPDSDFKGVLIALAGPAFGLLFALPFWLAAQATGEKTWLTGVFLIGMLNLINLAPAAPLDGAKAIGPALARIHPWLERGVLIAIAGLAIDWSLQRGAWLFAAVIVYGAARAFTVGGVRPIARPLSAIEWTASVGLYALVVALCAAVTLFAAQATGLGGQFLQYGGSR